MLKRLLFALVGLGAGVVLGVWTVRTLERTSRRLRPERLADAAGAQAGSLAARLSAAVRAGQEAAAEKERELRAMHRVIETEPSTPPRPAGPRPASGPGPNP
jgi:hypothetical protein